MNTKYGLSIGVIFVNIHRYQSQLFLLFFFRNNGVKCKMYYPTLKVRTLFRCFGKTCMFISSNYRGITYFFIHFPVTLHEDLFGHRTGCRTFHLGIRTRTGLLL